VTANLAGRIDPGNQGTGYATRFFSLQSSLEVSGDFEELAVTRFPDAQKRARVQAAFDRTATIQPFLERLIHEVLFEPLPACILQYAGQPNAFLPVQFRERVFRAGHVSLKNIAGGAFNYDIFVHAFG
jgi:hypothetical protein